MKYYAITELSAILDLHPKTILRFIHEGKIPARKVGRSWRVEEEDVKAYCHSELAGKRAVPLPVNYETLSDRISVSAVIEIKEQHSEEASRISNSILAMLNGEREGSGKNRFDFFYYPEAEKAKYVFYGSLQFISRILEVFGQLCGMKGDAYEQQHL